MMNQDNDRYPHDWPARSRDAKLSRKQGESVQCSCCRRFWPWDQIEVHHSSYEGENDTAGVNIFPVCGSKQDVGTCHHLLHKKGNWIKDKNYWYNRNTPAIVHYLQSGYHGESGESSESTPWLVILGAIGAVAIGWLVMSTAIDGNKPVKKTAAQTSIVIAPVNVRQGPGDGYPKVGKPLPTGAAVVILEKKNGWMRIKGNGDRSWIAGNYAKPKK